uniref:Myrcene synthase n=1 Tax=Nigella sativa TaxID=555479 RepID=A0A7D5Q170_NIGSA|nr:myrcene synthase [Nigella sativa]
MAVSLNFQTSFCFKTLSIQRKPSLQRPLVPSQYICCSKHHVETTNLPFQRRSANWKPNIWDDDFIKNIKHGHKEEVYEMKGEVLKAEIRELLRNIYDDKGPLALLEFIDDIQKLGLGYIFHQDIKLSLTFLNEKNVIMDQSLHFTALYFRLFRQYGYNVSQDVFNLFKDPQGYFKCQDLKSIVSLYQASFAGSTNDVILEEAKIFAYQHLKNVKRDINHAYAELVAHEMDFPLHYRVPRLDCRWYIDIYSKKCDTNATLLEFAKLDYNKVQAAYQNGLIDMSKWSKELGLYKNLPFARDRVVECFLWSSFVVAEPQYKYARDGLCKLSVLVTVIDDIYDVYSTLDEAKCFTNAVERWDVEAIEELPDYMKLCFFALKNTINEMGYYILKEQGINVVPYLRKTWLDLCKAYLLEAQWFHTGYKPTLDEYLDNAWVSIGGYLAYFQCYVLMSPNITQDVVDYLESYPNFIRWSCLILRLNDDMGTSKDETERGDVLKSVQCYMHNNGANEEDARDYIRDMIDETWRKVNAELLVENPLPQSFIDVVVNFQKTSESMYRYGDGHGAQTDETKGKILSTLIVPLLIT